MIPSIQPRVDDAAARRRIRESLDESLIVEAAAGTGKTTELVRRIVGVLAAGLTTIERVVAVTFTHKAAGELKLRVRQGLDGARAVAPSPEERRYLEDALARLEEASIGTIHSFCAQILRERPVEAVVDPAFQELSEPQAQRLYDRAFRRWFQRKLDEPAASLRRALTRLAWDPRDLPPADELKLAGWRLIEWRDHPAEWQGVEFDRKAETDAVVERVLALKEMLSHGRPGDALREALRPVEEFGTSIERAETAARRDYDAVESRLIKLRKDLRRYLRKGKGAFSAAVTREQVLAEKDSVLHLLEIYRLKADADLAPKLREEMRGLLDEYATVKREAGALDFVDLLLLARNLLRDKADVRRFLQRRYTHVFVDEFQDTDPLQAEVLLLLASGDPDESRWLESTPAPGKLFVVGDPKQSIYKFRRADVALYQSLRENLVARGVGLVYLTRSFRAVRSIQIAVNAAFEPEMNGDRDCGQAGYVPLEEVAADWGDQPTVVALPPPRPYGAAAVRNDAIDECLPDVTAAFVRWLLDSAWTVRDPESGERLRVAPRHIAILFRRFTNWGRDMTRPYVRGLEAREVPHLLVGSKSFHRREEVETLRAALAAIEWPDDELSVFATLKGALFGIPDDLLLRYRHEIGRLHPMRPADAAADLAPVAEALAELARLHRGRNRRPVAESVNLLLEAARAHAGFAFRPAGRQALANAWRIADLARAFEIDGGLSFRGFVEELNDEAEREAPEAPILEEGAEGVRLMTVHGAKGLEFPVVILADMTAKLAAAEPERYIDPRRGLCAMRLLRCAPMELHEHTGDERQRELAEGVRVAYVAATRARDLLVAPAVGDHEIEGWVAPLNKALYPDRKNFRKSRPAPACPRFGEATVLDRPVEYLRQGEFSVRPGAHTPVAGGHEVVWWDPGALRLGVEAAMWLDQADTLLAGGETDAAAASRSGHQEWSSARERELAAGATPSIEVVRASEAAEAPRDFECAVAVVSIERPPGRPGGRRFGRLVHAVLRDVALNAHEEEVARLARSHGRTMGSSRGEIDAAGRAVVAALASPLMARARGAGRRHRELPVTLPVDGGSLIEGVIDLAFLEDGVWTVVDFKTDAEDPARRAGYLRQLRWYALAISNMSGLPARAALVSL